MESPEKIDLVERVVCVKLLDFKMFTGSPIPLDRREDSPESGVDNRFRQTYTEALRPLRQQA
jgi:hypothetical protein